MHELIGAEVRDRAGARIGLVDAVQANPAHDLLVLDTGALVPMVFVVEHEPGVVVVDLPDGLSGSLMRIDVFTIFPDYVAGPLAVVARQGRAMPALLDVRVHDRGLHDRRAPHRWTTRRSAAAPGMVMMPEPLFAAVEAVQPARPLLLLSASGPRFDQARVSSPPVTVSRCCAGATKASTSASPITAATASSRSATTCSPAERRPRSS